MSNDESKKMMLLFILVLVVIGLVIYSMNKNTNEDYTNEHYADEKVSNVDYNDQLDNVFSNLDKPLTKIEKPEKVMLPTNSINTPTNLNKVEDETNTAFVLKNDNNEYQNFNLGVNKDDKKFTKGIESKPALSAKDLLPGMVTNKDNKFQTFNDLFNLEDAVQLEIPENKLGIDTVGQSRKNASYDIREAPPNPKFSIGPWNNTTIEPDYNIKSLC